MKKTLLFFVSIFFSLLLFPQRSVGLLTQTANSEYGYVLFAPLNSKTTYLIDKCGKQVRTWKSNYHPAQSAYLLNDGSLLRSANDSNKTFPSGGGRIEKYDWNNNLVWSYMISDSLQCQHHDIYPMPNGNVLVLVWEKISAKVALDAGRKPDLLGSCIWSEKIVELQPKGKNKAKIVWQWRVWDHLVQDFDKSKSNYGSIAQNPQLLDFNFAANPDPDWLHFNSVAYHPGLDQVVVSNRNLSELFIIDHSTSTSQAASHSGGKQKMGGDLLYRWGNPQTYQCGTAGDQKLFKQHSAQWINKGLKDEGKIIVFNNGLGRPDSMYSTVEIIDPPITKMGAYEKESLKSYLPRNPCWYYKSRYPNDFFSKNVSNAQRLSNGNMLINSGATGSFFEIDSNKKIIWFYVSPVTFGGAVSQGTAIQQNPVFRCIYYEPGHPAFVGKKIIPGIPVETGADNYPCILSSELPKRKR